MSFPAADYYGHPRATQAERHHFMEDMHSFIAAMHCRFPAQLAIIVGHPAMVATGPIGGYTAETGLVIASPDPLAADVVGAQVLGLSIQAVRHLWEASHLGPGVTDISEMEFPAMQLKDAIKVFTKKVYGKELTFEHP